MSKPHPVQVAGELQALTLRCQELQDSLDTLLARNRLLGDSAPFGIFTVDPAGRITRLNAKMALFLPHVDHDHPEQTNALELPAFIESGVSADLRRCMQERRPIVRMRSCQDATGDCSELRVHMSPILHPDGQCDGAMVFVEDYSLVKQAFESARESDRRYRLLFQSAPVAMIERDASLLKKHFEELRENGVNDFRTYLDSDPERIMHLMEMVQTIDFNHAFMKLMEAEDRAQLNMAVPLARSPESFDLARDALLMVAEGSVGQERERVLVTLKGSRKTVLARALAVSGHEDTLARIVITLVDITTRKQSEESLRQSERRFRDMAMRDTLTGLYNRRHLYHALPELIASGRHAATGIALLFLDLDNFKQIVDIHGHINGSRIIMEIAATIQAALSPPAFAVAYAGDEFVVVLPDHDPGQAMARAGRIQARIRESLYLREHGLAIRLQASCGVSTYPWQARDTEELLAKADQALFAAKGTLRGGLVMFGEE